MHWIESILFSIVCKNNILKKFASKKLVTDSVAFLKKIKKKTLSLWSRTFERRKLFLNFIKYSIMWVILKCLVKNTVHEKTIFSRLKQQKKREYCIVVKAKFWRENDKAIKFRIISLFGFCKRLSLGVYVHIKTVKNWEISSIT